MEKIILSQEYVEFGSQMLIEVHFNHGEAPGSAEQGNVIGLHKVVCYVRGMEFYRKEDITDAEVVSIVNDRYKKMRFILAVEQLGPDAENTIPPSQAAPMALLLMEGFRQKGEPLKKSYRSLMTSTQVHDERVSLGSFLNPVTDKVEKEICGILDLKELEPHVVGGINRILNETREEIRKYSGHKNANKTAQSAYIHRGVDGILFTLISNGLINELTADKLQTKPRLYDIMHNILSEL